MKTNTLPPIHPGEILREEFMKPRGLSQDGLARALNVAPRRVNEIVLEKRGIPADTALRLARYFGTSPETVDWSRRTDQAEAEAAGGCVSVLDEG
jgi:addiction module HigA family antidote